MLRLTSASDFERVRRDGRSHAHPLVVLAARRRSESETDERRRPDNAGLAGASLREAGTRVGVVAGRAVGKAVDRNRAKRLLREAARACQAQMEPGWDVVLIARAPLARARLPAVRAAVSQLLVRAGVALKQETK